MSLSEGIIIRTAGMTNVKALRKYLLGIFQKQSDGYCYVFIKNTYSLPPGHRAYLTFPNAVRCGHMAEFWS